MRTPRLGKRRKSLPNGFILDCWILKKKKKTRHSMANHSSLTHSSRSTSRLSMGMLMLVLCGLLASMVAAQGEASDIKVPQNSEWLKAVDLSRVPDIAVRPVGSGICPNATCDGTDNDRCFESCGNTPTKEDVYGCPKDHHWALTFDDGPSKYTHELLDLLDKSNIKATFCVLGSHVKEFPDVLRRAYQSGHQIASHTYSHPHLMSLTNEQIIYEVKATEEAIQEVLGITPKYIRPPFGEADARVKALLKSMGYKVLLWNVDPTDYDVFNLPDAPTKIQGAFKMAAAGKDTGLNPHEDVGFISLQHDLYKESIDQVPVVIDYLKGRGYKFVTSAECVDDKEPHRSPALMRAQTVDRAASASTSASSSTSSAAKSSSTASSSSNENIASPTNSHSGANTLSTSASLLLGLVALTFMFSA
ncbi:uncharacterized protein BYT42DRAFT_387093 [Radiomyces spectabilis]|uniref:uncharacterized protein n=1 Tax=Radiomyces spectabilis TaxID=64574 RepID=UPI00222086EC|nr:uncharacterized protein BYT42DRAFT_387093 [Radiomyces spectabilis]KAI8376456.1 hypothetical protein BYT42DRAFT_387093 [Radiomyces spectabilis]